VIYLGGFIGDKDLEKIEVAKIMGYKLLCPLKKNIRGPKMNDKQKDIYI